MNKPPLDFDNQHLYRDVLVTVIQAQFQMDAASDRAALLLNIS